GQLHARILLDQFASRDTDKLAGELIKKYPGMKLTKIMVSFMPGYFLISSPAAIPTSWPAN
ncbi:hypothetical protein RFM69_31705, partial [Pseudomonas aeruginosa]